ncbi:hypothetical protein Efla_003397 [Eimeria flavescens]
MLREAFDDDLAPLPQPVALASTANSSATGSAQQQQQNAQTTTPGFLLQLPGVVECMELVARGRLHPTMSDPFGKLPEGEENEEGGVLEEDEQRPSNQGSISSSSGREETTEVVMTTAAIPAEAKIIKTKTLEGPPGGDVFRRLHFRRDFSLVVGGLHIGFAEAKNWEDWVLDSGN